MGYEIRTRWAQNYKPKEGGHDPFASCKSVSVSIGVAGKRDAAIFRVSGPGYRAAHVVRIAERLVRWLNLPTREDKCPVEIYHAGEPEEGFTVSATKAGRARGFITPPKRF